MPIIDSHCHLEKFDRRGELPRVLERAAEAGVARMIAVGTSREDWMPYRDLAAAHPGTIDYSVGLHPGHVDADALRSLEELSPYFIPPTAPVALGEMGLDHFRLPSDPIEAARLIELQEQAFARQLELALQLDCPVIIHSRSAVKDCIRVIDESGIDWKRVVFHCWADGPELLEPILKRGGRASFTGILTFKNADPIRNAARYQGLDLLMLETDAPYLAPEPLRGKQNEPAYIRHIAEAAAALFQVPLETLIEHTEANTRAFFKLDA